MALEDQTDPNLPPQPPPGIGQRISAPQADSAPAAPQQQVPAQQPQAQSAPDDQGEDSNIKQLRQTIYDRIQRYSTPQPQGGMTKRLLSNFVHGMGQAMMHNAGLPTDEQQVQQATQSLNQLDQTQATIDYHKQSLAFMQQQKMLTISTPEMAESAGLPSTAVGSQLPATVYQSLAAANAKR